MVVFFTSTMILVLSYIFFPFIIHHNFITDWNKDWKPGPYPQTEEERIAAAKKYGLRVEDYKPFPDDGFGYGDYPDIGKIGTGSKDPFENWDIPEVRRNYGEPVSILF